MPFNRNADLPPKVRRAVPSNEGQAIMRSVVNAQLERGKSEAVAFASAWGALKRAGFKQEGEVWVKKNSPTASAVHVPSATPDKDKKKKPKKRPKDQVDKRQVNDDVYTDKLSAIARSNDLGLEGRVHVRQMADGQAAYLPGKDDDEYKAALGDEGSQEEGMLERAVRAIVTALSKEAPSRGSGAVLKVDPDQRIVWGWASVISENDEPVFDTQGDSISPEELTKAANEFMEDARIAKAMHQGDQVGEVIHSFPLTKELGDALGVQSDKEGWIVAMKIHDGEVWNRVKSGELRAFSIGGSGVRHDV